MAHKKGVGSSDNGRDSNSKRLGVKLFGGQYAKAGNIIIRQRGTKYHPGENVYLGKDFTVHANVDGEVTFKRGKDNRVWVSIAPKLNEVKETVAAMPKAKPAPKAEAKPVAATASKAEAKKTPAPKAETKPTPAAKAKASKGDDLTKVEGIGPKIAGLMVADGIITFADLAASSVEKIQGILDAAGPRYASHNPGTWPAQADFAAKGEWDKLKEWQDQLDGGREASSEEE
jgi:large subunit ribosomal protein L27